jgi:hypothetical protein
LEEDAGKSVHDMFDDYSAIDLNFCVCFNATFSNISAISCRPVLVVEEARVPGENHQP